MSGSLPLPPRPPLEFLRELERPLRPRLQEFDPVAATVAENRRSASRQSLPLPPTPPVVVPPPPAGESEAETGTPRVFPGETAQDARPRRPVPFNPDNPYVAEATRLARKYNLPEGVFLSLIKQESGYDPTRESPRGAYGLTQLMPGTARELGVDPRDPYQNLEGGARYLRQMIDRFGNLPLALAAYNAGPGTVRKAGNVIPDIKETKNYVESVMRNAGITHYAEGGSVRRPAAAPTMTPFDPDYIEQLAARAVGAGEPVTEVRSSEGRGFAPMARSFGEAGQRMSAVLRGDVEPTPEEERQINVVRGFAEGPASIRAYHGSPYRFEQFDPVYIGKGLGQQAYARGLYFAEAEPAAKHFRDVVSEKMMSPGYMYEVDLHAKPRDFLQYDQVWSKQSPEVRESLERFNIKPDMSRIKDYEDALKEAMESKKYENLIRLSPEPFNPLGSEIYNKLLNMSPEEASKALMNAGIPGTRYVDPGLRAVGQYHNYSVFDPEIVELVRRYAEGGAVRASDEPAAAYDADAVDRIVAQFAQGGEVEAPKETEIRGQKHKLAYITEREAALLKARGGSGRMTEHGIRAYDEGDGPGGSDSDSSNSNSEAGTQDAADGNAGQGAGPTGAGAGSGPGQGGPSSTDTGGMSNADPEGTPAAANAQTAAQAQQAGVRGADTEGFAPSGFSPAMGIGEAIGALGRGEIGLAEAIGLGLQSALAPPGVTVGVNVDETGNRAPAVSIDPLGVGLGLAGLATGVPGLGMIGGMIGSQISNAVGMAPSVVGYSPGYGGEPTESPGGSDQYTEYGQGAYGLPTQQTPVISSNEPQLLDWNQIQREANARNMTVSDYLAQKWRSPAMMAEGGRASLEQMYSKYNPGAVNTLAKQIEVQYV